MDKIEKLLRLFKVIMENKFTGSIKINFHNGNICNDEVEKVYKEKLA